MTDCIKGCTQVEEDEDGEESRISCHKEIIDDFVEFCLLQCYGVGGNRTITVHTGYCGIGENGVVFLRILEKKGRLEIGQKLEGSAPGFFQNWGNGWKLEEERISHEK